MLRKVTWDLILQPVTCAAPQNRCKSQAYRPETHREVSRTSVRGTSDSTSSLSLPAEEHPTGESGASFSSASASAASPRRRTQTRRSAREVFLSGTMVEISDILCLLVPLVMLGGSTLQADVKSVKEAEKTGNFMEDEQWLSTISQYSRKIKHWNRFRDVSKCGSCKMLSHLYTFYSRKVGAGGPADPLLSKHT